MCGLISKGIKNFHIDVGDGEFISRSFSGLDKLRFIKTNHPEIECNVHLMVNDPIAIESEINYIHDYADAGANRIAVHPRSHPDESSLSCLFKSIKDLGCEPGIIIELDNDIHKIWHFICHHNINWVVIMGVPIGYGGQFFNPKCLYSIEYLRQRSIDNNYPLLIEADGDLR